MLVPWQTLEIEPIYISAAVARERVSSGLRLEPDGGPAEHRVCRGQSGGGIQSRVPAHPM